MYHGYVVQFLSRKIDDKSVYARKTWYNYDKGGIDLDIELKVEGLSNQPSFPEPWSRNPDIGPYMFVDPFRLERWPTYLLMTANLTRTRDDKSVDYGCELLNLLKLICWDAMREHQYLKEQKDQITLSNGYRWIYISPMSDFVGNPVPNPKGKYHLTLANTPVGPGFAC